MTKTIARLAALALGATFIVAAPIASAQAIGGGGTPTAGNCHKVVIGQLHGLHTVIWKCTPKPPSYVRLHPTPVIGPVAPVMR